jgi:hypothetical protein
MVDVPLLAWLLRSVRATNAPDLCRRQGRLGECRSRLSPARPDRLRTHPADTAHRHQARQGEGSRIVKAAHAINHGQPPVARSTAAGDLNIVRAKRPGDRTRLRAKSSSDYPVEPTRRSPLRS